MVSRETSTDLKHDKSAHSTVRETRFHSSKPQQPIPTNQPKQTSMFHVKHQPQQLPEKKQRSQTTNSRTDQPHNVSRGTISVIRRSLLNPGSRRVFGDSGVSRETRQDGSTLFQTDKQEKITLTNAKSVKARHLVCISRFSKRYHTLQRPRKAGSHVSTTIE